MMALQGAKEPLERPLQSGRQSSYAFSSALAETCRLAAGGVLGLQHQTGTKGVRTLASAPFC
eukprot:scaffold17451_cov18-Tisochrysis_lutea.AAC.1